MHPTICKLLGTDHGPLIELMRRARRQPGVKQVFVASGVRMDLARRSPAYIEELAAASHGRAAQGGPGTCRSGSAAADEEAAHRDFAAFEQEFRQAAAAAGKEQYLVPYFMAGHPGCDLQAMIDLAVFLKRIGYRPDKVQDFIPVPMDIATCMYYTGIDPIERPARSTCPRAIASDDCSGRCCSISSRKTMLRCARPCDRPAART